MLVYPPRYDCSIMHWLCISPLGYNAAYITDAIADTKAITLSMGRCLDPLRVDSDSGRIAVVMPVRV